MDQMVPIKIVHGEERAWELLAGLDPTGVCRNAAATYDPERKAYRLRSFGMEVEVSLADRTITSAAPHADLLLDKLRDYSRLALLWYLVNAKDIACTERLIKPVDVKGGQRFSAGTHLLPLDKIAEKYGADTEGFISRAREFGAAPLSYGDASVRLFPVPRVPVTIILWREDEEYPPRVDLLLDSSCNYQIASSDIIWATALMSALVMLLEG